MNKKIVSSFIVAIILFTGCTPALAQTLPATTPLPNQDVESTTSASPAYECKDGICPMINPESYSANNLAPAIPATEPALPANIHAEKLTITIFVRPGCPSCKSAEKYINALIADGKYAGRWQVDVVDLGTEKTIADGDDPATLLAGREKLLLFVQACKKFGLQFDAVPVIVVNDKSGYRGFDLYSPLDTIVPIEADMIECEAGR